ncbi:hypothetical protein CYMTET_27346, partial [Cymbomonas tetramitiformis]
VVLNISRKNREVQRPAPLVPHVAHGCFLHAMLLCCPGCPSTTGGSCSCAALDSLPPLEDHALVLPGFPSTTGGSCSCAALDSLPPLEDHALVLSWMPPPLEDHALWRVFEKIAVRSLKLNVLEVHNVVKEMRNLLKNDKRVLSKLHRRVFIDSITKNGEYTIYMSCYVEAANRDQFMGIKEDVLLSFLESLGRNGCELATPVRKLMIHNANDSLRGAMSIEAKEEGEEKEAGANEWGGANIGSVDVPQGCNASGADQQRKDRRDAGTMSTCRQCGALL